MGDPYDFSVIARKNIGDLVPYKGGKPASDLKREIGVEEVFKFASNESPIGPSPMAASCFSSPPWLNVTVAVGVSPLPLGTWKDTIS